LDWGLAANILRFPARYFGDTVTLRQPR
jgi:hypothetical protein